MSRTFSQISDKVYAGERLDLDDAITLFHEPDILKVGQLANLVRERMHGDRTYFNVNMRYEATNVCVASCHFCAFAKLKEGDPGAHTAKHEDAWKELADFDEPRLSELHMVNGLHPDLPFEWYEDLLRGWKRVRPSIHLKCFTAIEIHFFAEKFGMSYEQVLTRLRAAGLDSLPGGGAEILHDDVRRKIAKGKADGAQYLQVHRVAHRLGIPTNCTMLYGHIETLEHRADHLVRLRALQDESLAAGNLGFRCFIPLSFHNENNMLEKLPEPTAIDDIRTIAVSRLMLDNIAHIKAYWVSMTIETAQLALRFGADDIDGTIVHETIYHAAGSRSPMAMTRADLVRVIQEAGRVPVERDSVYNVVEAYSKNDKPEAALTMPERRARKSLQVVQA